MAATITDIGSNTSIAAPTSITTGATITATTSNNDWLVVIVVGADGAEAITGVTDSAGNTYTQRVNAGFVGSTSGTRLGIYTAPVTTNITNGTITASFPSTSPQCAIQAYRVRPSSGTVTFVAADTTGVGAENTSHTAATVSVTNGNTIFGAAGVETDDSITADSDTTNGSWSTAAVLLADSGTDINAQTLVAQYKTVSATGNQSWTCATVAARPGIASYLVLKGQTVALSLTADLGQYTMSGTAMTPHLGNVPIVAGIGSYALTGTAATFINSGVNKTIAAAAGDYSLLGTDVTLTHGYKLDATTAGSYALTGTAATTFRALPMVAGAGSYSLLGTNVVLTKASLTNKVLTGDAGAYLLTGVDATVTIVAAKSVVANPGSYAMAGTDAATTHQWKATVTDVGSYVLTGADVALSTAANKVILALPGSYALVGTDVALTAGVAPPSVSPLHIGEWPIDKKARRRREDARAKEQQARDRFRRAIDRLLEGLPPEFDEPADLDEALDTAVQASNLLYALSAPIREINAVNELIDHIRQLRIAQPIAQLHLAQAYNQTHRHLMAKAEEDAVMTLMLGEYG